MNKAMKTALKALITYVLSIYANSTRIPKKAGSKGFLIYADITSNLAKIERLANKCGYNVITSEPTYTPAGKLQPAKAYIGPQVANVDADSLFDHLTS